MIDGTKAASPFPGLQTAFIETAETGSLIRRALRYLEAGFPVHFRGPAGTGKTTLALQVARKIGRPIVFLTGDATFTTANLLGSEAGVKQRHVVDQYITRVKKTETEVRSLWVDEFLTHACVEGLTLIYDEFTRSRPEANNALLTALQERLLVIPSASRGENYVPVHPEFRAIFTSNPSEYAGVHVSQDALLDRLLTIDIPFPERATEAAIVAAHAGIDPSRAARIVDLVRDVRLSGVCDQLPTMRASIMIARVAASAKLEVDAANPDFVQACLDCIESKAGLYRAAMDERKRFRNALVALIGRYCSVEVAG